MTTAIIFAITFAVLLGVINGLPNIPDSFSLSESWNQAWNFIGSSLAHFLYMLPSAVATDIMIIINITTLLFTVWLGWITFRTVWGLWVK